MVYVTLNVAWLFFMFLLSFEEHKWYTRLNEMILYISGEIMKTSIKAVVPRTMVVALKHIYTENRFDCTIAD